jgi:putative ABC transport system ATP-binding protein
MIQISGLKFGYSHLDPLLIDVPALEIPKGQTVFILGPSGSGKSTFLNLLTGTLNPVSGTIRYGDCDFSKLSPRQRDKFRGENMGYVFQLFNLLPFLTAQENIQLILDLNPTRAKKCEIPISHFAKKMGISDILHVPAKNLSVGQAQRVAIVRALIGSPSILIADEPTSSLDSDSRDEFLEVLFSEVKNSLTTLIFVSHDKSISSRFDRTLHINELKGVKK